MIHFGFLLNLSDKDLSNIDLFDQRYTHLDLLDTNIPSIQTFSRRLARCLQDVFRMCLQDVFKTSWRRLGRRKIVTLKTFWRRPQTMSWRRLQEVLKTNKCLLGRYFAFNLIYFSIRRSISSSVNNIRYFILNFFYLSIIYTFFNNIIFYYITLFT